MAGDPLWGPDGLHHRMDTLEISFRHRASALVHYGHTERAAEAEHAAAMIRFVLTTFEAANPPGAVH